MPVNSNEPDCIWPIHRFAMRMLRRRYYEAQDGQCGICRARMKKSFGSSKLTFDHVWPKSWSANCPDAKFLGNLLLAHANCNTAKDDTAPEPDQVEFLYTVNRKLGFMPHETALWDAPAAQVEVR